MADCGLRRIGALTGLGRIAGCILGIVRCKAARFGPLGGLGPRPPRVALWQNQRTLTRGSGDPVHVPTHESWGCTQ
eukprot:7800409-Alexandrium_andersonii.AAC.1